VLLQRLAHMTLNAMSSSAAPIQAWRRRSSNAGDQYGSWSEREVLRATGVTWEEAHAAAVRAHNARTAHSSAAPCAPHAACAACASASDESRVLRTGDSSCLAASSAITASTSAGEAASTAAAMAECSGTTAVALPPEVGAETPTAALLPAAGPDESAAAPTAAGCTLWGQASDAPQLLAPSVVGAGQTQASFVAVGGDARAPGLLLQHPLTLRSSYAAAAGVCATGMAVTCTAHRFLRARSGAAMSSFARGGWS